MGSSKGIIEYFMIDAVASTHRIVYGFYEMAEKRAGERFIYAWALNIAKNVENSVCENKYSLHAEKKRANGPS
jgi:hypothetical protein